ncbi:MAG TPA: hypothetical protein VGS19_01735 [Streptosporangiaceae bacterium]|nr:hypothetical protein [Streptosporangiaceae bacterium]
MVNDDISPDEASAALSRAGQSAQRVRSQARWMSTYLGVFSAGFAAITLTVGLVRPLTPRVLVFVTWAVLVAATVAWSRRRPASIRGAMDRVGRYWIVSVTLYAVALAVGTPHLTGHPMYWVPAALAVAAPLMVGAFRERRA